VAASPSSPQSSSSNSKVAAAVAEAQTPARARWDSDRVIEETQRIAENTSYTHANHMWALVSVRRRFGLMGEQRESTPIKQLVIPDHWTATTFANCGTRRGRGRTVWPPDGTRIAFASNRDGDWDIYTMRPDGTDVRQLTMNEDLDEYPTWFA